MINENEILMHGEFARLVKERANYTCEKCGSKECLRAHHIKPRIKGGQNILSNGICLCSKCHSKSHPNIKRKILIEKLPPVRVPDGTIEQIEQICKNKISPSEWIRNVILKAIKEELK